MEKTNGTLHWPHSPLLTRNIGAVQSYIKNTFEETKNGLSDGLSLFKEGLSGRLHKTGNRINAFALPVNNFIKDISQIERDFEEERAKNEEYCLCLAGQMVPANEVLKWDMEENY